MEIQCECGKFRAQLTQFPKNTPGRIVCYCRDCQAFLNYLKRTDLMDQNGGTEIIPAYPADLKIVEGQEQLKCLRLSPKGMFRFYSNCCQTPIANTDAQRPWIGVHRRMYTVLDATKPEKTLGEVKSRFMGQEAIGTPPKGTPLKFDFKTITTIMPYIFKGLILGKAKPSPFFKNGQAIVDPMVLTSEERLKI